MRAPLVSYCVDEVLSANLLCCNSAPVGASLKTSGTRSIRLSAAHLGESLGGEPKSRSSAHARAHAVGVGHSKKPYLRERSWRLLSE